MLANLLVAMSVGKVGGKMVTSQSGLSPHAKKFASLLDSSVNLSSSEKTITTDNNLPITAEKKTNKPSRNFGSILSKKTVDKKQTNQEQNSAMTAAVQMADLPVTQELPVIKSNHDKTSPAKVKSQFNFPVENVKPACIAPAAVNAELTPISYITIPAAKPQKCPLPVTQESTAKSKVVSQDIPNKSHIIHANPEKNSGDEKPLVSAKPTGIADNPAVGEDSKTPSNEIFPVKNKENQTDTKPVTFDNLKTQLPDVALAAVLNRPTHAQQKGLPGWQSFIQPVQEISVSKIETHRKNNDIGRNAAELKTNEISSFDSYPVKAASPKTVQPPVQLSCEQTKNSGDSIYKQNTSQNVESAAQVFFSTDNQQSVREQSPPGSRLTDIGNTDSAANVRGQIREAIHSSLNSDNRQIVVTLNPPELGRVAVKFQEQSDGVTGIIRVDRPETKQQIHESLPEIIQNLQNSGVQIKSIEVVLTNKNDQYYSGGQSTTGHGGWSHHQNLYSQQLQKDSYGHSETNITASAEIMESHARFFDGSINILI